MPPLTSGRNTRRFVPKARPAPKKKVKRVAPPSPSRQAQLSRAQARTYGSPSSSRRAAATNRRDMSRARKVRMAQARKRYFPKNQVKAAEHSQKRAIAALAALRASDPEGYKRRQRSWASNAIRDTANWSDRALHNTAEFLKQGEDTMERSGKLTKTSGLRIPGAKNLVKEGIDIAANTPAGLYQASAAGYEAAHGDTKRGAKLVEDFKKHSALYPAAKAAIKNAQLKGAKKEWKEAGKRASERPLTTALELSGVKAIVGRSVGAAGRSYAAARGRPGTGFASTQRNNLKLYDPKTEGKGPEEARRYSRDVINKGLQKGVEAYKRKRGRDPDVDLGARVTPNGPQVRYRLRRRVNTRVASTHRVVEQRRRVAAKNAKQAWKNPATRPGVEQMVRADLIRGELRRGMRVMSPEARTQARKLMALSDRALIQTIERNAKGRTVPGPNIRRQFTAAEKATIAKTINRRVRKGKPLSPGLRVAVDAAIGNQIKTAVARRSRGAALKKPMGIAASALTLPHKAGHPNLQAVNAAFKRAGGQLPIVARPFRNATSQAKRRGGYAGVKTDRATGEKYHLIYYNGKHGNGAQNYALWFELNRALQHERLGPEAELKPTVDMPEHEYLASPGYNEAKSFADANADTDLFQPFGGEGALERRSRPRDDQGVAPLSADDFSGYFDTRMRNVRGAPQRRSPTALDRALADIKPLPEHAPQIASARAVADTLAESRALIADEFGLPVSDRSRTVTTRKAAQEAANRRIDADLEPIQRGPREWMLAPRAVVDQFAAHERVNSSPFGPNSPLDRHTGLFKDVVLTSASPFRWLGGNVADIGMRTLLEGITPLDIARGIKIDKAERRSGLQGEQSSVATTGGGLYGVADDLASLHPAGKYNVPKHVWRAWKRGIFTLEHAIEKLPQYGMKGKEMRRQSGRRVRWTPPPVRAKDIEFHNGNDISREAIEAQGLRMPGEGGHEGGMGRAYVPGIYTSRAPSHNYGTAVFAVNKRGMKSTEDKVPWPMEPGEARMYNQPFDPDRVIYLGDRYDPHIKAMLDDPKAMQEYAAKKFNERGFKPRQAVVPGKLEFKPNTRPYRDFGKTRFTDGRAIIDKDGRLHTRYAAEMDKQGNVLSFKEHHQIAQEVRSFGGYGPRGETKGFDNLSIGSDGTVYASTWPISGSEELAVARAVAQDSRLKPPPYLVNKPEFQRAMQQARAEAHPPQQALPPERDNVWTRGPIYEFFKPWDAELGRHVRPNPGGGPEDLAMKTSLKSLLKLHENQVNHFAEKLSSDRAFEAMIQKRTEDVIGRWGKISPTMRRTLSLAPFAQWLGAATRYVYVTLPVHHPIKTGILAGIMQMTEDERKKLGLSYYAPVDQRAPDYQMGMLPLWQSQNKYGPVTEGIRTSRMTSFGTAAGAPWNLPEFVMPQVAGLFNTFAGRSFTGEPLLYPPSAPEDKRGLPMDLMDRLPVALGAQAESMVPFASAFRRAYLERGLPSDPSSTILTPQIRQQFNYDTGQWEDRKLPSIWPGLGEWALPFAPRGRLYPLGVQRDIEESQTTTRTLKRWNKERSRRNRPGDIFAQPEANPDPQNERDIFAEPDRAPTQRGPRDIFGP